MKLVNENFAGASACKTEKGALARLEKAFDLGCFSDDLPCFVAKRPDGKYIAVVVCIERPNSFYNIPALADLGICLTN